MSVANIPGRSFLDTSVVNFMLDYGPQIHDGVEFPVDLSEHARGDIEALRGISLTGQRAQWQFAISPHSYKEVISTQKSLRRRELESWFFEIWGYWRQIIEEDNNLPTFLEAEQIRLKLLSSGVLDAMPDMEDRLLLCDAIVYRCDCFCTRDWNTILKHREALCDLPIKVLTPTEWWALVRPHSALWT